MCIFNLDRNGKPVAKDDVIFDCINYTFMILITLVFAFPLLFVISTSFMSQTTCLKYGYSFFPREFDLTAYKMVLEDSFGFAAAFKDTIVVTVIGTALNLIFTAGMGYGLAKKDLPYRNLLTGLVFLRCFLAADDSNLYGGKRDRPSEYLLGLDFAGTGLPMEYVFNAEFFYGDLGKPERIGCT